MVIARLIIVFTDRYYFLENLKKVIEVIEKRPGFFPKGKLVYDRKEKSINRPLSMYNNTLVEYAKGTMEYLLELPNKETLINLVLEENK